MRCLIFVTLQTAIIKHSKCKLRATSLQILALFGCDIAISPKSQPSCMKFRTCSKPLRYRGEKSRSNHTEIATASHFGFFFIANSWLVKLASISTTKIAQQIGGINRSRKMGGYTKNSKTFFNQQKSKCITQIRHRLWLQCTKDCWWVSLASDGLV